MLQAAVALADEAGIESLSMRRLGQELGVEAMSLYNHVANKDDLLNGITDLVLGEIELPDGEEDWKSALRRHAISAHDVLVAHRLGLQAGAVARHRVARLGAARGLDAPAAARRRLLARGDVSRVSRPRRAHPRLHAVGSSVTASSTPSISASWRRSSSAGSAPTSTRTCASTPSSTSPDSGARGRARTSSCST